MPNEVVKKILLLSSGDGKQNKTLINRLELIRPTQRVEELSAALELIEKQPSSYELLIIFVRGREAEEYDVAELKKALGKLPLVFLVGKGDIKTVDSLRKLGVGDVFDDPSCVAAVIAKSEKQSVDSAPRYISAQTQLKAVLDNMAGAVALLNVSSDYSKHTPLYLNHSFFKILDIDTENTDIERENFRVNMLDYLYKEDLPNVTECIKRAVETNQPVSLEFRMVSVDLDILWVSARFIRIDYNNLDGTVILVIFNDITYEKFQQAKEKAAKDELHFRADHDVLTGIYNKQAFMKRTADMLRSNPKTKYILAYWNVDRFRLINDLFGVEAGDTILKKIAEMFSSLFESDYTYGRLEADHFATCFPEDKLDLEQVLKRIKLDFSNVGIPYHIFMNFGLYRITDVNLPVEQMCSSAYLALQTVNGNYLKPYAFYDVAMREAMIAEQGITNEMEEALRKDQFFVYLQPIFSLSGNEPISAEALVRWNHPQKGIISPAYFIPVFERTGFISRLDHYIWEKVCALLAQRKKDGKKPLPISVNLSRRSIYGVNLVQELVELTKKYDIDPRLLKLEITETAYTDDPAQLSDTVAQLQKNGFLVMMDDFGSGYSSLNMLKDLPVDALKIDMKFIEDFETSSRAGSIITSVLRMAKWLKLPVIAEGVETKEQNDFLRSIGCDQIQGYYFAKPMPVNEFEDYITQGGQGKSLYTENENEDADMDMLLGGNRLISHLMDGVFGAIAFYELTEGGGLEVIRANSGYYDVFGCTPLTFGLHTSDNWLHTHEQDIPIMRELCTTVVDSKKSQRGVVRCYHTDGHIMWLDCLLTFMGKSTGTKALICIAFSNVTDRVVSEQRMIEQNEVIRCHHDFLALLNATIPCGIAHFLVDEFPKVRWYNDACAEMLGYTKEDFNIALVPDIREGIYTDDRALFGDGFNKCVGSSEDVTVEYRAMRSDGGIAWLRTTFQKVPTVEGTTVIQSVSMDITDTKRAQQEHEIAKYSETLFSFFDEILEIDFEQGIAQIRVTKHSYADFRRGGSLANTKQKWLNQLLSDEDRPMVEDFFDADKMRNACENGNIPHHEYTAKQISGNIFWCSTSVLQVNSNVYLFCSVDITERKTAEILLEETSARLDNIIKSIPIGIGIFELSANRMKVRYMSNKTCEIFGYTDISGSTAGIGEQKLGRIIFDLDTERRNLYNDLTSSGTAETTFLANKNDGSKIWVHLTGSRVNEADGVITCYAALEDVTQSLDRERQLKIQEQSYQIMLDDSQTLIFDYDVECDSITYSFINKSGKREVRTVEDYSEYLAHSSVLHPESLESFRKEMKHYVNCADNGVFLFRADFEGDGYCWFRATAKSIADTNGSVFKILGKAENVDDQTKQIISLKQRAEYDSITGLYNHITTEEMIQRALGDIQGQAALLIIDIDDFKKVNDMLGHMFGDAFLKEVGDIMKVSFRADDIVGRFGGDEFFVFMSAISAPENIFEVASRVISRVAAIEVPELGSVKCSIGATIVTPENNNYGIIFNQADSALYEAKNLGKNRFILFDRGKMSSTVFRVSDSGKKTVSEIVLPAQTEVFDSRQQLAAYVFQTLYSSSNLQDSVNSILERVGTFYNVSRVSVFEVDLRLGVASNSFEWCAQGIPSVRDELQQKNYKKIFGNDYENYFNAEGIFYCKDVSELPSPIKETFVSQGIHSLLQCRICDEHEYVGFVGFEECGSSRFWTQEHVDSIIFVSEVILTFLRSYRNRVKAENLSESLISALDNSPAFIYVIDPETYTVEYVNKKVVSFKGDDVVGKKCYDVLVDLDAPCASCSAAEYMKNNGKFTTKEMYNHRINRWYSVDVAQVDWYGKKRLLITNTDITELKNQQKL